MIKELAIQIYQIEPDIWVLSRGGKVREYREMALALTAWWNPKRARMILEERATGRCECPCDQPFRKERRDPHHIINRAQYWGPFRHNPRNMALVRGSCHDAITGRLGKGIDQERVKFLFERIWDLPSWYDDPRIPTANRREKPGTKDQSREKSTIQPCKACGKQHKKLNPDDLCVHCQMRSLREAN